MKHGKLAQMISLALALMFTGSTLSYSQTPMGHPYPQPMPMLPAPPTLLPDGITFHVDTSTSPLPVGQNELQYVESNVFDSGGNEVPNTLPSRPGVPFNLHDGPVVTSNISKTSPKDDLNQTLTDIQKAARKGLVDQQKIQFGLDILEGNAIANRVYSGFALLHYTGPEKIKVVDPVTRNVNIHQIWYDNHIESDTALLDVSTVKDVPYTITYTLDVLNGGADDFSPFVMYFDLPNPMIQGMLPPLVAMDATFYPMNDGKRFVIKLKQAPGKYYNLTYTWGWRIHPPRVQVTENSNKTAGLNPDGTPRTLAQWEIATFGSAPRSSEASKLAAIAQIGELAPAKRMWQALRNARTAPANQVVALMTDALISFNDWSDRTHLPRGVQADANADVTLFFVNNTIYGNARTFTNWNGRGSLFKATVLNGDHFVHGYMNVDFGGSRGWENQFQDAGGPGSSHTFGRNYWWINAGGPAPFGPINIPPAATDGTPTLRKVEIVLNHDGPERIKLYQFDPLHHDVAVYSLH